MYNTYEITAKEKSESFTVKVKNFDKHNAFAYGYGYHDKSGRAKHKVDRKQGKSICRDYMYS